MSDSFWFDNPNSLLDKEHITQIWPSKDLELGEKLNAVTRLVIILTFIGYFFTRSIKILVSAFVTLVALVIIYKTKKKPEKKKKDVTKEGFGDPMSYESHKQKFEEPSKENPLQNVLPLDIEKNPKRKPAAPAYHPQVEEKINKVAEKIGFDKKLFSDLGDNISFQNSMRNFYSMPNTRVPNAQKSFALFCYGDMKSCKEGDKVQCVKNTNRYTNF